MFKKLTSLILAILLVLSLAGCSKPGTNSTADTKATETANNTRATDATEVTGETEATEAFDESKATKATQPATKATTATKATATKATVTTKSTAATKATQAATKATTATTISSPTESTTAGIETDEKLFSVEITLPASIFESEDMSAFDADAYADEQGFTSAKVNKDGSVTVTMTKAKHKELLDEMSASLDKDFQEFVNGEDTPYIKEITHNDDFTTVTMKVDKAAYKNAFDFTPFAIALSVSFYQAFTETEYHVVVSIVDATTGESIDSITYPDAFNS